MARTRGREDDGARPSPLVTASDLEALYDALNRRKYVRPDPLEFVYRFDDPRDREVVGFVAASLAFGRVAAILSGVERALSPIGPHPAEYLASASGSAVREACVGFRHRWTTGGDLAELLLGLGSVLARYGSLERCFARGMEPDGATVIPALGRFVHEISGGRSKNSLLACPDGGSACKRLNLFLRWMARSDDVDPGVWGAVSPAKLVVPLDTHMHRISLSWGLTRRATPNLATALEITESFRRFAPDDPVRYDFAITRLGIRNDVADLSSLPKVGVGDRAASGGRKGRER